MSEMASSLACASSSSLLQAGVLLDLRLEPFVGRRVAVLVVTDHRALQPLVFGFERELHIDLLLFEERERPLGG